MAACSCALNKKYFDLQQLTSVNVYPQRYLLIPAKQITIKVRAKFFILSGGAICHGTAQCVDMETGCLKEGDYSPEQPTFSICYSMVVVTRDAAGGEELPTPSSSGFL